MIRRVEQERDSKLAALEIRRLAIIEDYSKSIAGVESELQRTVAFLQVGRVCMCVSVCVSVCVVVREHAQWRG